MKWAKSIKEELQFTISYIVSYSQRNLGMLVLNVRNKKAQQLEHERINR